MSKIIAQVYTVSSKPDSYGNAYHIANVTFSESNDEVFFRSNGESNAPQLLRHLGLDWEEIEYTHEELPIRQWNKLVSYKTDVYGEPHSERLAESEMSKILKGIINNA